MSKWDFDTVIPGHGPVTNKAGLKAYRDNVEKVRMTAARMIREGKTQDDVGKAMTADFGWPATGLQMPRTILQSSPLIGDIQQMLQGTIGNDDQTQCLCQRK